MILIRQSVYNVIDRYINYLINEGITSRNRAFEKKNLMIQSLHSKLGGLLTHRPSPYRKLGKEEGCLLYVYKDAKSKSQWGFAYKRYDGDNVIAYYMMNLKLV